MRPFLHGFADELLKLAAFPQQSGGEQPYTAAVAQAMNAYQGAGIRMGLKTGLPIESAPAAKKPAPTPLTTPNSMVDVASKSGGG